MVQKLRRPLLTFDAVVALRVADVSICAIARVEGLAWNTRSTERLEEHLDLLRCYYDFVRPHRALKFGQEIRTPAMQAELVARRLTLREVFACTPPSLIITIGATTCAEPCRPPIDPVQELPLAA